MTPQVGNAASWERGSTGNTTRGVENRGRETPDFPDWEPGSLKFWDPTRPPFVVTGMYNSPTGRTSNPRQSHSRWSKCSLRLGFGALFGSATARWTKVGLKLT